MDPSKPLPGPARLTRRPSASPSHFPVCKALNFHAASRAALRTTLWVNRKGVTEPTLPMWTLRPGGPRIELSEVTQ